MRRCGLNPLVELCLDSMRLFVGIGLPTSVAQDLINGARNSLAQISGTDRQLRWIPAEDVHLTLYFLGSIESARLGQIQKRLAEVCGTRLYLKMDGIDIFAKGGILIVKVEPKAHLLELAERVAIAMDGCGVARERRPYIPHVTLARSKGRIPFRVHGESAPIFRQGFEVSEFRLYESFTRSDGAQYQVLSTFRLA
jgi:RNA 2',3'-cyclic 3'-phosphodiesterase